MVKPSLRVFAALPIPEDALRCLEKAAGELERRARGFRVLRPESMHITLIFFGELEEGPLGAVQRALDDPCLAVPSIQASIGGLGQFPPRGVPRVFYCPVRRGAGEIEALYRGLREKLLAVWGEPAPRSRTGAQAPAAGRPSWDDPRPFTPHITVARNRGGKAGPAALEDLFRFEQPITLDRLVLFQSLLRPEGAEYRPLKTIRFAGERGKP